MQNTLNTQRCTGTDKTMLRIIDLMFNRQLRTSSIESITIDFSNHHHSQVAIFADLIGFCTGHRFWIFFNPKPVHLYVYTTTMPIMVCF